ncbi:plastocyanin [Paraburkholderia sp. GAS448]|uniref:cupredoxin domain-containing protein n=1 Tax=Paraburkholderia sp. GAS448 TaxID=3035136 RepID=UPI003D258B30
MLTTILRRAIVVPLGFGMLMAASADFSVVQAQESNAVVIKNFMFSPMSLTINAGSTVTWKNLDGEPHTVVNDAGVFHSAALDQNDTFQFKFDKPGVYKVFCGIHPTMKETITVQ